MTVLTLRPATEYPLHPPQQPAQDDRLQPHGPAFMPGLDGVRGIAIALVLGVHASVPFMTGGGIGVDVFFVLSGFLISRVLIAEYGATGTINFRQFYWRRSLRILPPLLAVCVALVCLAPLARIPVATLASDLGVTLTFVSDYTRYRAGHPPLYLASTWSLSVEEQFYLLWPACAVALMRLASAPARIIFILVGTAAVVALWRYYCSISGVSSLAIYDAFDTRCDALCLGCALAFLNQRRLRMIGMAWPLSLAGLAAATYAFRWDSAFAFNGGFIGISILSAILVAAAASRQSDVVSGMLEAGLLPWLGKRSYSVYLWHWPLAYHLAVNGHGGWMALIPVPVGILLGHLSFRYIEQPVARFKRIDAPGLQLLASFVVPALILVGVFFVVPRLPV